VNLTHRQILMLAENTAGWKSKTAGAEETVAYGTSLSFSRRPGRLSVIGSFRRADSPPNVTAGRFPALADPEMIDGSPNTRCVHRQRLPFTDNGGSVG
jgi:hypothetical protein